MAQDLKETIYESLNAKYKGEREEASANIMIYLENPSGIGEHPDVIAAIALGFCSSKLNKIIKDPAILMKNKYFGNNK